MTRPLVIVGAGGFGREVVEIVRAINAVAPTWDLRGILDDRPSDIDASRVAALGLSVVGPSTGLADLPDEVSAVIAIGDPGVRQRVAEANPRRSWAVLVHPHATMAGDVTGPGVIIAPGARVSTNVTIGRHVHIDQNVTVGHDCVIEPYARLNPQACISGSVTIGEHSLVGAQATVLQGLTVGAGALVGASACVVRDVACGITVKGVPAK